MRKTHLGSLPRYAQTFVASAGTKALWQEVLDNAAQAFLLEQRELFKQYRKLHTLTEEQVKRYANGVKDIVICLQHGFTPELVVEGDEPDEQMIVLGYKADGGIGTLCLGFWF